MQVQVNTSNGVDNKETLERWASDHLHAALARFSQDLTRVEVQLSDENSAAKRGAADIRCMLEARLNGREPVAVQNHGETQDEAFRGATQKLVHAIDHVIGKLDRKEHRSRETIRRDPEITGNIST